MERPELLITIDKEGKVRVQVQGVSGERCLELADLVKEIVGIEEQRQLTGEYYGPSAVARQRQLHQRERTGR
ncbi:MAG: DUF2997 domain-containing protein [Deltaproteobacteria bacterium]|nr:DUF2997 domain-containing protein [Deltaproteobacteria bacterium]